MTTHISPAIIMRTWEFGESDLMVSFFTSKEGRLKGVAKGARKSRKRFANCLDLFCLTHLEYERKGEKELYFLLSGKLMDAYPGLRSDFSYLSLASYMIEFTEILFPVGVAAKRMFELLQRSFSALNGGHSIDKLRILFETKAMALGGYGIDLSLCCCCGRPYKGEGRAVFKESRGGIACLKCEEESARSPGLGPVTVKTLKGIQSTPWDTSQASALGPEMIREIKPVLKRHIQYRIGQRLKTAEYLE
ncbi:MAG: DNA repair protein RecO [Deltaproteobacteria bacterium]|nr:DNA repair protein RecO [Deltaproteobacteria bacterium]